MVGWFFSRTKICCCLKQIKCTMKLAFSHLEEHFLGLLENSRHSFWGRFFWSNWKNLRSARPVLLWFWPIFIQHQQNKTQNTKNKQTYCSINIFIQNICYLEDLKKYIYIQMWWLKNYLKKKPSALNLFLEYKLMNLVMLHLTASILSNEGNDSNLLKSW